MERLGLLAALSVFVACQATGAGTNSPLSGGSGEDGATMLAPAAHGPAGPAAAENRPAEAARPAEAPSAEVAPSAEPEPEPAAIEAPTRISRETIWRWSADDRPPWKTVTVADGVIFGDPPKKGEQVTVVPMKPSLPTLQLEIVRVKHEFERWTVVLEPIEDRAYFDVKGREPAFPVDVLVVYPATPSAELLPVKGLAAEDLPPSAPPRSVELAVDIDDDGLPDTVELTRCTDNPKRAKCFEATAWETYRRVDGEWTLCHTLEPIT